MWYHDQIIKYIVITILLLLSSYYWAYKNVESIEYYHSSTIVVVDIKL